MVTINRILRIDSNRKWLREFIAEFMGTFLLVFLGNDAVAESVFSNGLSGNAITVYLGYSLALFLGITISLNISGAHLNPAVTVASAFAKKFQWRKVPHYLLAQYLGAFVAAIGTYILYIDSFYVYYDTNGIDRTSAGIFATYPKDDLSIIGCFIDQILGTMILVIMIYSITDKHNQCPKYLVPLFVSLALLCIACSIGINQGFALNPARDLSPRIFTYLAYWGSEAFSSNSYWYATIIGSHIGAILGAALYILCFEKLHPDNDFVTCVDINEKKGEAECSNVCYGKKEHLGGSKIEQLGFSKKEQLGCSKKEQLGGSKKEVYTCYL